MQLQVVYDEHGNIIATSEVSADPGDFRAEIIPDSGQFVALLDVPEQYQSASPLQRHEQLRVDVDAQRLLERDEARDD